MRSIIGNEKVVISLVLLAMVLFALLPLRPPRIWLYPLLRDMAQAKLDWQARDMAVYETEHFRIKYTAADEDTVIMVAQAAEAAYRPVTAALGVEPRGKTLLLVYPDRREMNQVFGWSGDQSAMGVYWGGVIQLLSPHGWLQAGESTAEFIRSGPMVHEFTHLVFDHMTNGNYSRWFTEGLAQYVEYKTSGYEWLTNTNRQPGSLYSQADLDGDFDNLPDQSLAYRASLTAIRYIAEVYGEQKLQEVMRRMQQGQSCKAAIADSLELDYEQFGNKWRQWAVSSNKQ